MQLFHYNPEDFSKGTTAKTKEQLLNDVLNKNYNKVASYKTPKGLTVNNFVNSVNKNGEKCITFTFRYGRKPIATFVYEGEDTAEAKQSFINEVHSYIEETSEITDKLWSTFKSTSYQNGLNASGTSLQVTG